MHEPHPPAEVDARQLQYEVDGARLIEGVGLRADAGELIGLIGPNGAGKSTLLRTIAGILQRTGGEVRLEGGDLDSLSAGEIARRLALLGQHAPDTFGFTALEVVLTGRYPHLGRFEIEGARDREIALDAMVQTDAAAFAERDASTLSGGERQRVFVARALAQQPRILLLDEPTASLDVHHQLALVALLRELVERDRLTVIAAVHDLRLAARHCDRLVLVHRGRVVADGAPEAVLTPAHIADVFGVRAAVYRDPVARALTIDFLAGRPSPPVAVHVHVTGGLGHLAPLLDALTGAGFRVTADPLAEGSVARLAAEALGVAPGCEHRAAADVVVHAGADTPPPETSAPVVLYSGGTGEGCATPGEVLEAIRVHLGLPS